MDDDWYRSTLRHLRTAQIEKITSVVSNTYGQDDAAVFERVSSGTYTPLKLMESKSILSYSIDFISAATDLPSCVVGLKRGKSGRRLGYGPPGTAKTAYWEKQALRMHSRKDGG